MSFKMTDFAKRLLIEGWPDGRDPKENPFSTTGRLRFDSFRLEPVKDVIGGYRIVFMFAGRDIFSQDVPHFEQGMVLTMIGIEGSVKFEKGV